MRKPSDTRSSALWGTGTRGGDSRSDARSSALWGKGGRGLVTSMVAVIALMAPLAATANPGKGTGGSKPTENGKIAQDKSTYVANSLRAKANSAPGEMVNIIVQSRINGAQRAEDIYKALGVAKKFHRRLDNVGAVAITVPAAVAELLGSMPSLIVTPDAPVAFASVPTSTQLWPHENGVSKLWGSALKPAPQAPTIAFVDSGIDTSRLDFAGRIAADVKLSTLEEPNTTGDSRGHGTFVAGIAAGNAPGYAGAAPNAKIVSLDVMNDQGMARTSDVIAAADWILKNKDQYNIRVANFSLHSTAKLKFYNDPLDRAVERLWFAGVTVVAAAGNYGTGSGPSGVKHAPGNDPFVITVGAVDLNGSAKLGDDASTTWTSYGRTSSGFLKPELAAAGRYMVGPIPGSATLTKEKASNLVGNGYIQLSGTSFSAPVVAGAAAQILARNPSWTPDQVKGALMVTTRPVPKAAPGSVGVGQVNVLKATERRSAPNPNAALNQFVVPTSDGSGRVFNDVSWVDAASANRAWDAVTWADATWADMATWADATWADATWADATWADATWADATWADTSMEDATWADTSVEDNAAGESTGDAILDMIDELDIAADPDLQPEGSTTATSSTTSSTTSTGSVGGLLP